jgi:hypothetical protein
LTLTEVTIVGVIAVLVMLTLTSFYFNSQRTWIEGSTKAVAQREATLVVEHLAQHIRQSWAYDINSSDPLHHTLTLWEANSPNQFKQFTWRSSDELVHELNGPSLEDQGPISTSKVERFQFAGIDSNLVALTALELESAGGDSVLMSSTFRLYNHRLP